MNTKLTALIIDDDSDLCFMLGEVFRSKNFDVATVSTLDDAKSALMSQSPTIIILDNSLPDGKGSEFLPFLVKTCPYSKVFLISGDYESVAEEFPGITHFIHKPFTLSTFRSAIDSYLQV